MKLRVERSGLHWFDRTTGMHVLFDEVHPTASPSVAPRTLSIAVSNVCDLRCPFCYRPKNADRLRPEFVQHVAAVADALGCLEVTFGGGEPLLWRPLAKVCDWIWSHTALGVGLTTHGQRLVEPLVSALEGRLSSLRVSIDGPEPYYTAIRGRPLASLVTNLRALEHRIPFGLNAVVSPGRVSETRAVARLACELGATDLLVIPEHARGRIRLGARDFDELRSLILDYQGRLQVLITANAVTDVGVPVLDTEALEEFTFAHISADGLLKHTSYADSGVPIGDPDRLADSFRALLAERTVA